MTDENRLPLVPLPLWHRSIVTTVIHRLTNGEYRAIITAAPGRPIQWRVSHVGGVWDEWGESESEDAAKAAVLEAIPRITKERDEYYARVNPKLYGPKT